MSWPYDAEADRQAAAAIDAMRLQASRIWREERATEERALRAELVAKVREAISAVVVDRTAAVLDRQAQAAVDVIADYYRARITR